MAAHIQIPSFVLKSKWTEYYLKFWAECITSFHVNIYFLSILLWTHNSSHREKFSIQHTVWIDYCSAYSDGRGRGGGGEGGSRRPKLFSVVAIVFLIVCLNWFLLVLRHFCVFLTFLNYQIIQDGAVSDIPTLSPLDMSRSCHIANLWWNILIETNSFQCNYHCLKNVLEVTHVGV